MNRYYFTFKLNGTQLLMDFKASTKEADEKKLRNCFIKGVVIEIVSVHVVKI